MKTDNTQIIKSTDALPYTTDAYSISEVAMFAIQLKQNSGSSTVKLQGSCDEGQLTANAGAIGVFLWTDIAGSTQVLASGDDLMYDFVNNGYNWVRIVVNGTGSVTARINTKGV